MQDFPSPFTDTVTFLHCWGIFFSYLLQQDLVLFISTLVNENMKNLVSGVDSEAICPFVEIMNIIFIWISNQFTPSSKASKTSFLTHVLA